MLTTMQIMSAAGVVAYFGRELSTSEYYTAEHGVWYGKGAERLGLSSDLTKEDFVAIANNRIPQSGKRLTARTNDTRTHIVWERDEETQSRVPKEKAVNNRRVCVDFTFSVPKSVSMYLAKTKDEEVEKLIHEALRETMDDMEVAIQTRVRIGGADHDRTTGNAIWAKCIHLVIECHHRLKGDLRPGEQWEVTQVLPEAVVVTRSGREKFLPLCQSKDFNAYYRDTMPIAASEHLLITKNNRGAHLRNGDLRQVQASAGNTITLDNGYKLDASKPLHIRQGYTMTSQASQGHENLKMFAFLPVSATSQINAVQMLVSLSRASREVRLYTDSKAVLREAAIRPGQGASAIELIDGESNPEVDLWQIGHNGETTKEAEIIREVQRSRRMMKREQICEAVRKTANREMGVESCIER
jgi:TrwC relaxase